MSFASIFSLSIWLTLFFSGPYLCWALDEQDTNEQVLLADYSQYPGGWEISGDTSLGKEIYQAVSKGDETFLRAVGREKPIRIFKKISWDPSAFPIIEWKWRVNNWAKDTEAQIYIYISLDKDIFGIPTIIKYVWSQKQAVGTIKDGGFFRPSEIVIKSGLQAQKEWATQRIDALEDFQKMAERDPKGAAYGIGILVDPGMEVEFGKIVALKN